MEISKLRLSGFKSFVEPATLHIEPGLTGVVGPNGCGKSNLLEAIRWVMGENSPKSMRSGGMEDVVFAGTAERPPRQFAEVVLTGADDSGDELEVIRRIERGAGSAYRVNGNDVRAKDVALAFADAATGAHSPALVSQGKIAHMIAAKPVERRAMLEEAAGIAGLHVRRKDAESKLRQTETNLARLEDLLAGLDSQITSLRRQAKQAERYAKLTDEIGVAEARLVFARWRDAAASAQAARKAAGEAEAAVPEQERPASVVGARLLIVDDNHINLMVAEGLCQKLGYETEVAESGLEAIAVLMSAEQPFDLVLMDCEMPDMDGFETSRAVIKLQQEGRLPWVPIIALTAHAIPDKIHACHDAGMIGHLAKPVNLARLQTTLRQILRDGGTRPPKNHNG